MDDYLLKSIGNNLSLRAYNLHTIDSIILNREKATTKPLKYFLYKMYSIETISNTLHSDNLVYFFMHLNILCNRRQFQDHTIQDI